MIFILAQNSWIFSKWSRFGLTNGQWPWNSVRIFCQAGSLPKYILSKIMWIYSGNWSWLNVQKWLLLDSKNLDFCSKFGVWMVYFLKTQLISLLQTNKISYKFHHQDQFKSHVTSAKVTVAIKSFQRFEEINYNV